MERKDQLLQIASAITENKDAAEKYAAHLEELFDSLLPQRIGTAFAASVQRGDYKEAVRLCAAYYREKAACPVPELSASGEFDTAAADKSSAGGMREVNIDWNFPDGDIDFLFDPTAIQGPRNHEWLWQLNRHSYWINMARSYQATGDEKYAVAFEKQLLKWIAQTDIPEDWNGPGSAWRTIESGIRLMGSWQVAFDGFRKSPSLSDTALLLMIASMHRQSVHLVGNPTSKNWLMMESNGVYTYSGLFTELLDSEVNRKIAAGRLLEELEMQLLPDGMQYELSPDYQSVVYHCASNFYSLAVAMGLAEEIPSRFVQLIQSTVNAAILLSTPGFTQPRTNDTYTIYTSRFTQTAERLFGPDPAYRFVNTNRMDGQPPAADQPSVLLPYAGFAVMRSDWNENAAYLCFDIGPLGMGHMHQDKLNINLYKGNQELIYDDGGGQYEMSPARTYGVSGYAHNTALVDGLAQHRREPLRITEPVDAGWISTAEFDYAVGRYDETFGSDFRKPATHTREVRFCKPGFFCVADRLTSADDAAHDYEILFHMDTTKVRPVSDYPNAVISEFRKKYEVLLIPLDEDDAAVRLNQVSARTEPDCQGWYVGRNESNIHAAITVSRKVKNVKNFRFNTLLFPVTADSGVPEITRHPDGTVTVLFEGKEYRFSLEFLNQ